MSKYKILKRFLVWRLRNVNDRQFMMIMSGVVGFLVGLAAVIIKNAVYFIERFLTSKFATEYENYSYKKQY